MALGYRQKPSGFGNWSGGCFKRLIDVMALAPATCHDAISAEEQQHEPHPQDLHDAFPDDADVLRRLKSEDAHFQSLAARFDAIDTEVRHIAVGDEAASDARLEDIKKHRLALLDEIAVLVAAAKA